VQYYSNHNLLFLVICRR